MTSSSVFLSHSTKDRKVAVTVCEALEHRGFKCWMASRDIAPGENFQETIVHAIRDARVMILVFTENSNNSNEVKKELALGSQHNLVVIPVRVEDVLPSDALTYELATRQWIDLFEDWENSIERLAQQISSILSLTSSASSGGRSPTATPARPPTSLNSGWIWKFGLIGLIVAIGLGFSVWIKQAQGPPTPESPAIVTPPPIAPAAAAPSTPIVGLDNMDQRGVDPSAQKSDFTSTASVCQACPKMASVPLDQGGTIRISRGHITVGEWQMCVRARACGTRNGQSSKSESGDESLPITRVSWNDARDYNTWLTETSGQKFRLPTDKEWEAVMRHEMAATQDDIANIGSVSTGSHLKSEETNLMTKTDLIGTKGSVADWIADCRPPHDGAISNCQMAIVRGTSWRDPSADPLTQTDTYPVASMGDAIGFRVVMEEGEPGR